jgi:hypothetical protein
MRIISTVILAIAMLVALAGTATAKPPPTACDRGAPAPFCQTYVVSSAAVTVPAGGTLDVTLVCDEGDEAVGVSTNLAYPVMVAGVTQQDARTVTFMLTNSGEQDANVQVGALTITCRDASRPYRA